MKLYLSMKIRKSILRQFALAMLLATILVACSKSTSKFEDYDLIKHGLSIKIKAPLEPEVSVVNMGIIKDVTIKKGEDYNVQVISSAVSTYDVKSLLADKKKEVEEGKYFAEFVIENENGFVFKKMIDEENINYDFRVVRIVGDTEYSFQTGLLGNFTQEQAEAMFEAVQ